MSHNTTPTVAQTIGIDTGKNKGHNPTCGQVHRHRDIIMRFEQREYRDRLHQSLLHVRELDAALDR